MYHPARSIALACVSAIHGLGGNMLVTHGGAKRPLLLLITNGMRQYREYLLRAVSAQFDIHLYHTAAPAWGHEYLSGWTLLPSTLEGEDMARVALTLHRDTPISGVLCWS